jgi:lipopolysaccharide/colanic/teichoic acid biosynthesis glycosyltransferase
MDWTIDNASSRFAISMTWLNSLIKRGFDIIFSFFALLFFSPIFGIIALAIKRDSPGPVIYRGPRMGRGGKEFSILKFRTMAETPQSYSGPRITAHDDPRVTSIGRWLRDTKLNEFPQFWNVLLGDMSLVGPRPEDPEIVQSWPAGMREEILSVRPGITSPATVHYRDEEHLLSTWNLEQKYLHELSPDKLRLDQLYVRYRSISLDLDILLWTFLVLLPKMGLFNPPEDLLFFGVISRLIHRFLNWFTIDILITFFCFGLVGLVYRVQAPLNAGWLNAFILVCGYALVFNGFSMILGTNRVRWSKASPHDIFDLLPPWILATINIFLVNGVVHSFPPNLILVASALALVGFGTCRYHTMIMTGFEKWLIKLYERNWTIRERVLIVGLGASAQHTAWLLEHLFNSKYFYIIGFVDNDLIIQGMRYYGSKVLGKWDEIPALVKKHDIGVIIMADYRVDNQSYRSLKEICASTPAKFIYMPDVLASINRLVTPTSKTIPQSVYFANQANNACLDCLAKQNAPVRKGYWKNLEKQTSEQRRLGNYSRKAAK